MQVLCKGYPILDRSHQVQLTGPSFHQRHTLVPTHVFGAGQPGTGMSRCKRSFGGAGAVPSASELLVAWAEWAEAQKGPPGCYYWQHLRRRPPHPACQAAPTCAGAPACGASSWTAGPAWAQAAGRCSLPQAVTGLRRNLAPLHRARRFQMLPARPLAPLVAAASPCGAPPLARSRPGPLQPPRSLRRRPLEQSPPCSSRSAAQDPHCSFEERENSEEAGRA